jgi:hypothetical protein
MQFYIINLLLSELFISWQELNNSSYIFVNIFVRIIYELSMARYKATSFPGSWIQGSLNVISPRVQFFRLPCHNFMRMHLYTMYIINDVIVTNQIKLLL